MANDFIVKVLATVIGGLILAVILQGGNKPIVQLVDSPNYLCQDTLGFNGIGNEGYFSVRTMNVGKDGAMYLNFESNDVLSKVYEKQNFSRISKSWGPSTTNGQINFGFALKKASNDLQQRNITLAYVYGCYNDIIPNIFRTSCTEYKVCCVYTKDDSYGDSYKRASESYC